MTTFGGATLYEVCSKSKLVVYVAAHHAGYGRQDNYIQQLDNTPDLSGRDRGLG